MAGTSDPAALPCPCPHRTLAGPGSGLYRCSQEPCRVRERFALGKRGLMSFRARGVLPCSLDGLAWFYSKVKLGARLCVWTASLSEMGIFVGNGSALLSHLGIRDDRKWGPVFPAINYASDRLAWPGWDEHRERRAGSPSLARG